MEEANGPQFPDAKWGILAVLYSLPVLILFACFGEVGRGMTAGLCTAIILGVVKTFWNLRKHLWFWITVAILSALQAPFVIFFPIPMIRNFTVWSILPVAILDFGILYGCIKLAEKVMNKEER